MSSCFGENLKISVFGQSHSSAIGVVIDGLPAGITVDFNELAAFMGRRAPSSNVWSTKRREKDEVEFVSGFSENKTCGAPICALIHNKDAHSKDYSGLREVPRPSHADFTAFKKYGEAHDINGGGHFSGRLTAPLCIAGAIAIQILKSKGIQIGAHISSIGTIKDKSFDAVSIKETELQSISRKELPFIDDTVAIQAVDLLKKVQAEGDSVGASIECAVIGIPEGIGGPMFGGIEGKIAFAMFAIPAVKGIEFGRGFQCTQLRGSQNNDSFFYNEDKKVCTKTNNSGGILGGISNGMPIVFKIAIKPTPSISKQQQSVNLKTMCNEELKIHGRHDPCIAVRAVPVVEAVTAISILDLILSENNL